MGYEVIINLWRCIVTNVSSSTPHFLELHSYFIESFRNNSYEDVLHKPCQEKYHRAEVKNCAPSG